MVRSWPNSAVRLSIAVCRMGKAADCYEGPDPTHNGHYSYDFERDITLGYLGWALLVHEFAIAVYLSLMIRVEMVAAMLSKDSYGPLGFANDKNRVPEFDT